MPYGGTPRAELMQLFEQMLSDGVTKNLSEKLSCRNY